MHIWKLKSGLNNELNSFVYVDEDDICNEIFVSDGTPKNWPTPPKIQPFVEKRKKKQKPLGDINYLLSGSVVLNEKAYSALKDFLAPFGQLLEMDCQGEKHYYYNVTNMIPCIDFDRSETEGGAVIKEVFLSDAVPKNIQVFKEPYRKRVDIYLNDPAKDTLEKLISDAGLTGAQIVKAG